MERPEPAFCPDPWAHPSACLIFTDGQRDSVALADTAIGHDSGDAGISGKNDQSNQNNHSQCGIKLQFLSFLLLGQLLFGQLFSQLGIAELLLAGCTHGLSFPLICPCGFITQWENCG